MSAVKITDSMRTWCKRLADGSMCRWVKSWRASSVTTTTGRASYGSPSYVMVDRMEEAGLITWRDVPNGTPVPSVIARLTPAGWAIARQT